MIISSIKVISGQLFQIPENSKILDLYVYISGYDSLNIEISYLSSGYGLNQDSYQFEIRSEGDYSPDNFEFFKMVEIVVDRYTQHYFIFYKKILSVAQIRNERIESII